MRTLLFNSERNILIALLSVVIIGIFLFQIRISFLESKNKQKTINPNNGKIISPSLLDANSGLSRKDVSFLEENTYLVKLQRKPNTDPPKAEYIPQYLTGLLQLPLSSRFIDAGFPFMYNSKREISNTWDTRQPKPLELIEEPFKRNYYLLLPKGTLDTAQKYENDSIFATVERSDPLVLPYLNDSKYCQRDSDCAIGYNFCSYGSFNSYKLAPFGPYGCGGGSDADYVLSNGINYSFGVQEDPELGCITQVKYASAQCIINRCIGQGRTVSCAKNEGD